MKQKVLIIAAILLLSCTLFALNGCTTHEEAEGSFRNSEEDIVITPK